ncbi:MAG: formate/nitrite transporter family protein [Acidimicrobiia bacterium]
MDSAGSTVPATRYIPAGHVLEEMARFGEERIGGLSAWQVLVLAAMGGAFITAGALFATLLAVGHTTAGVVVLVEGMGFSAGFFFVVLSEAVLFTEANVVLPATMLERKAFAGRMLRFWLLAFVGNLLGAIVVGWLIRKAQVYPHAVDEVLGEIVDRKMAYRDAGGVDSWMRAVLSGALANWLIGMAAFFATMARSIIGKYIPVFLAVTLFVAANFQHSPANMGFFSLAIAGGGGPGWGAALGWNLVPAGIGNVLGGALLVAVPFWYALRPRRAG